MNPLCFMTKINTQETDTTLSLLDTGANCIILKSKEYFLNLTSTSGEIKLTSGTTNHLGAGLASFRIKGQEKIYTTYAYYNA